MEKKHTKEIILEKALELFSNNGYEAVTVADIAEAVGIKAPSLYKHYKSKQEIFNSLVTMMDDRYEIFSQTMGIEEKNPVMAADKYIYTHTEELINIGTGIFLYFLHDEYAPKFYKIMTVEQFKNNSISKLYVKQNIDSPLNFQKKIFQQFIAQGKFKNIDPMIAALHFYAPIFLLINLCYNYPEREEESLELVKKNIIQFVELYERGDNK